MQKENEENRKKREEAKICSELGSCPHSDENQKKCRSNAHLGCANYIKLRNEGLI